MFCEHCGTGPDCAVCGRAANVTHHEPEEWERIAAEIAARYSPAAVAARKAERKAANQAAFARDLAARAEAV